MGFIHTLIGNMGCTCYIVAVAGNIDCIAAVLAALVVMAAAAVAAAAVAAAGSLFSCEGSPLWFWSESEPSLRLSWLSPTLEVDHHLHFAETAVLTCK